MPTLNDNMDIKAKDIFSASKRIKPYINKTPIKLSAQLNTDLGLNVFTNLKIYKSPDALSQEAVLIRY